MADGGSNPWSPRLVTCDLEPTPGVMAAVGRADAGRTSTQRGHIEGNLAAPVVSFWRGVNATSTVACSMLTLCRLHTCPLTISSRRHRLRRYICSNKRNVLPPTTHFEVADVDTFQNRSSTHQILSSAKEWHTKRTQYVFGHATKTSTYSGIQYYAIPLPGVVNLPVRA